jgi:ribosome-binding protein aMBF1 (putative translation factor)
MWHYGCRMFTPTEVATQVEALADVIRRRRDEAGVSDASLAEKTLIPRSVLQRALAGIEIQSSHLVRIAHVLGTTPARLWAEVERHN